MKRIGLIIAFIFCAVISYGQQIHSGGINIATGFKLSDPQPIDDRYVVQDSLSLLSIPNIYTGLWAYSLGDSSVFVYDGIKWERIDNAPFDPSGETLDVILSRGGAFSNNYGVQLNGKSLNFLNGFVNYPSAIVNFGGDSTIFQEKVLLQNKASYTSDLSPFSGSEIPDANWVKNYVDSSAIFATVNDMMAYTGNSLSALVTDALRGGLFYKTPDGTIDSGTIFPASDGSRWNRFYDKSNGLNVLWYGADPTGVNNSRQAFADAILSASTFSPKKSIAVTEGIYRIDTSVVTDMITLPDSMNITGYGNVTIQTSSNTRMISIGNKCTIKGIEFRGSGENSGLQRQTAIAVATKKDWTIENISVVDFGGWYNGMIYGAGIVLTGSSSGNANGNLINVRLENNRVGILAASEYVNLIGIMAKNNQLAIGFESGNLTLSGSSISNNQIGLKVGRVSLNNGHSTVSATTVNHNDTAFVIDSTSNGLSFLGCHFYYGTKVISNSKSVQFTNCHFASGKTILNNNENLSRVQCRFYDTLQVNSGESFSIIGDATASGSKFIFRTNNTSDFRVVRANAQPGIMLMRETTTGSPGSSFFGRISIGGYNGTYYDTNRIAVNFTGTHDWTPTSNPFNVELWTCDSNSITPQKRVAVTSRGDVSILKRMAIGGEFVGIGNPSRPRSSLDIYVEDTFSTSSAFRVSGYASTSNIMNVANSSSIKIGGAYNSFATASAILDIESTTSGVLLPRGTYAQMIAIPTPANGLEFTVLDNDANFGKWMYNGNTSTWIKL